MSPTVETPAEGTTASSVTKKTKVLACVHCQSRKKKCDRKSPCSICIKKNLTCIPSTPAPSRSRRQPTKELLDRMSRCEELLRQCLEQRSFDQLPQIPTTRVAAATGTYPLLPTPSPEDSTASASTSTGHEGAARTHAVTSPQDLDLRPRS